MADRQPYGLARKAVADFTALATPLCGQRETHFFPFRSVVRFVLTGALAIFPSLSSNRSLLSSAPRRRATDIIVPPQGGGRAVTPEEEGRSRRLCDHAARWPLPASSP